MLYLGTGSVPARPDVIATGLIGYLASPLAGNRVPNGVTWAADNGCFNADTFNIHRWVDWLNRQPRTALWATVPDAVGDHDATLELWHKWAPVVTDLGFRPAFVIQNGCASLASVPNNAAAVFVGGDTRYKLSETARIIVQHFDGPTHMGRVNSLRRLRLASAWGIDTVDGTFLAYAPDLNLERLLRFMRATKQQPTLEGIQQ